MRAALINYFVGSAYRSTSGYEIKTFLDVGTHQELWDWQQEHFVKLYHVDAHYNGDRFAQVVQVCPPASLKCTGRATRRLVQIWQGELIIILHLNCAERSRHPDATHANNIGVSANTAPEQKRDLRQLPAVCGICRRLLCRCYSTTQSPKILLCILTRLALLQTRISTARLGLHTTARRSRETGRARNTSIVRIPCSSTVSLRISMRILPTRNCTCNVSGEPVAAYHQSGIFVG